MFRQTTLYIITSQSLKNGKIEDSVSLNSFPWPYSALSGQAAQSVVIGLPFAVHVGNKTPIYQI